MKNTTKIIAAWAVLAWAIGTFSSENQTEQPSQFNAPQALPHEAVAREYFGVIETQMESIDWLELHRDGHRRALFKGETSRWLQP